MMSETEITRNKGSKTTTRRREIGQELTLSPLARSILEKSYLHNNEKPEEMFRRVAEAIEQAQRVLDLLLEPEQRLLPSKKISFAQLEALLTHYNLSKAHLDYLESIAQRPFLPVHILDAINAFSLYQGWLLRQQLSRTSPCLIYVHRITSHRRGRVISAVELTDAGRRLVDSLGIKYPEPVGHGGPVHKFWQYAAFYYMAERNHRPQIDCWRNNKVVDVGVEEWQGKSTALEIVTADKEIEMEKEKEMSRLICALNAGWDRVILCTLTQKEQDVLKNEMSKWFKNTFFESGMVGFMKLHTFLEHKEHKQS